MNIVRTLGYVTVAALSLGVSAAMAQNDGAIDASAGGFPANSSIQAPAAALRAPAVQSGSSDVDGARTAGAHLLPGNNYDIPMGGGSGG